MDDRWLSVDEICTHLGVSRDTVYKWIDQKNLPAHRVGRLWKFKKAEVDDWVRGALPAGGTGSPARMEPTGRKSSGESRYDGERQA